MKKGLREIAEQYRLPIKRIGGQEIVQGKRGYLCTDDNRLVLVFTDDGRSKPLTPKNRGKANRLIGQYITKLTQDAEVEFIAQIEETEPSIRAAIATIEARHLRTDAGVSRPMPWHGQEAS